MPAYQRRTKAADALIAGAYLAGTNTRRVRRALKAVFAGEVGKDVVSWTWRKVKGDWDAWNARSLTDEPIIRLILDGTVVRVRLDKKATSISLLVALGVREDGQKVLLAIKNMGGESEAAWRALLDDLVKRGLKTPELVIVDALTTLQTWLKDDVVNVTGSVGMVEIVDRLLSDDKYNPGLGPAVKILADQLRARAADITRGAGLPTLPVPFVPQVVEKQKPGPTIEVYALQHLRWKQTAPGELCSADAFHIVALPSHYAKLALERSLALPPDHPRVQEMVRNKHGPSAGVPRSVDLDERSEHGLGL